MVLLGVSGIAVGWFLNIVVVRMPADEPLFDPPPRCPDCEAPLAAAEQIPLVSYVRLRGRCAHCGDQIPLGYPLVELGNGLLWVLAAWRFGGSLAVVPVLLLFSTLLVQSVIDLEHYRLLDKITFPVLGASIVLIAGVSALEGDVGRTALALAGAVGYFLFLFVPAFIYPRGMGLGDVKLALLMGLFLGWVHPLLCLYALVAACILGLAAGVVLFFARGRQSTQFPFGPWLAVGCVVALLGSGAILDPELAGIPAYLA
jgi:leader peptidase (prepilin peptidase)/N-methyltransferase